MATGGAVTARADDPDGDDVTYSLAAGDDSVPQGAAIDPVTGEFDWTPATAHQGASLAFDVVAVDDGQPQLTDREPVTITPPPRFDVVTGGSADPDSTDRRPPQSPGMSRTVIAVVGGALEALPLIRLPLLLLAGTVLVGLVAGRLSLLPVTANRERGRGIIRM